MAVEFDEHELAVLRAISLVGGVTGREWFRSDRPGYREAFDRLAAKKYIMPEYFVVSDVATKLSL